MTAKRRPANRTRPKQAIIWLTDDEHARLMAAARAEGLGVGPWLRMLGIRESARPSSCGGIAEIALDEKADNWSRLKGMNASLGTLERLHRDMLKAARDYAAAFERVVKE